MKVYRRCAALIAEFGMPVHLAGDEMKSEEEKVAADLANPLATLTTLAGQLPIRPAIGRIRMMLGTPSDAASPPCDSVMQGIRWEDLAAEVRNDNETSRIPIYVERVRELGALTTDANAASTQSEEERRFVDAINTQLARLPRKTPTV